MKYYSKSPAQIEKEREKKEVKQKKKRRWGNIILFADLMIVILIAGFMVYKKDRDKLPEVKYSETARSFLFRNYRIVAGCENPKVCKIKLADSEKTEEPVSIAGITWQMKDYKTEELLFEETTRISENISTWVLPQDADAEKQIYALILNNENEELLNFRVFP